MSERLRGQRLAIALLAGSLFDALRLPSGSAVRAERGEVPSRWEPCEACGGSWLVGAKSGTVYGYLKGSGWLTDRFGRRKGPCEACGGYVREDGRPKRGAGRIEVDSVTLQPVGVVAAAERSLEEWPCNVCSPDGRLKGTGLEPKRRGPGGERLRCRACGGRGLRTHAPFVLAGADPDKVFDPVVALEAAITRRDEEGDWRLLEHALADLRLTDVVDGHTLHRLWTGRYVYGDTAALDDAQRDLLELAWRMIEARMPERPRVPGWVRHSERERKRQLEQRVKGRHTDPRALARRDAEIRKRYNAGEQTVDELVRTFGVSKSTVYEAIHGGAA